LAHVHLHAKAQKRYEDSAREDGQGVTASISKTRLSGLISSLLSATNSQTIGYTDTEWGDYYADTNYVDASMQHKEEIVGRMLVGANGKTAADFGANTGRFSRLASSAGYYVLSHDIDETAVDKNYRKVVNEGEENVLPLLLDLSNPSPGLGWANTERSAFTERKKVDVGMALALIHHLALSNNVPLDSIADLFVRMCKTLIVEFVPKTDSQVKRLLATREDVFPHYNQEDFESTFGTYFEIDEKCEIKGTERTLYFMRSKS
jgi:ribosomal protein L11 methylase PrmA